MLICDFLKHHSCIKDILSLSTPMCQDQIHNKLLLQNTDPKLALFNLSMSGEAFSSKLLVLFYYKVGQCKIVYVCCLSLSSEVNHLQTLAWSGTCRSDMSKVLCRRRVENVSGIDEF